jgi:prepilin-type N-terminal cleavage/methylation domain-containing protein
MHATINRMRQEEGFTLIELMIVMVVLGILAGIIIFAVGGFTEGADSKVLETNTKQCRTAQVAKQANAATDFNDFFDDGTPPAAVDLDGDGTEAACTATGTE